MAARSTAFDTAYEGTPTWDIGRPQPAVVRLAEAGVLAGEIIDVGCGTGENALFLAARGHHALGIDFAAGAVARARAKAKERGLPADARGLPAEFLVGDALDLPALGRTFDTALDVGLFHTLQPEERRPYADSLAAVLRPGGRLALLCWSTRNPFGYGPTRIAVRDIRAAFHRGWTVESIEPETLETLLPAGRAHAWLALIRRSAAGGGHRLRGAGRAAPAVPAPAGRSGTGCRGAGRPRGATEAAPSPGQPAPPA
ncbi:MAG: class I SAM-dependent methyltransferase [Chloroflexi bacterium]|nr:class I SAM-dependent methyltransferase [Chloroflexota bacterium]